MKSLTAILLFFVITSCQSQATHEVLDALDFSEMITDVKHPVILDVRTPGEYSEGHIQGAKNMDFYEDDFESNLAKLDKTKTYFVYCAVGGRSGSVAKLMHSKGFEHFYDLKGGINNWENQGLPISLETDED